MNDENNPNVSENEPEPGQKDYTGAIVIFVIVILVVVAFGCRKFIKYKKRRNYAAYL